MLAALGCLRGYPYAHLYHPLAVSSEFLGIAGGATQNSSHQRDCGWRAVYTNSKSSKVVGIAPPLFLVPKRTILCTKMMLVPSALKATLERVVSSADVRTCVLLTSKSRLLSYASYPHYAEDLVKVLMSLAAEAWREVQRDDTLHGDGGLAREDQIAMVESEVRVINSSHDKQNLPWELVILARARSCYAYLRAILLQH